MLTPSHFPFNPLPSQSSRLRSPSSASFSSSHPSSPYPPYILALLVLTFPPLLFVLSSSLFPIRILCLVLGQVPLLCTHPLVRPFYPYLGPMLEGAANYIIKSLIRMKRRVISLKHADWSQWVLGTGIPNQPHISIDVKDGELTPLRTILERIMDDDKLSDRCWRAEMREVELWENERFVGMYISSVLLLFRSLKNLRSQVLVV
jgi:hypothetical protein